MQRTYTPPFFLRGFREDLFISEQRIRKVNFGITIQEETNSPLRRRKDKTNLTQRKLRMANNKKDPIFRVCFLWGWGRTQKGHFQRNL